MKIHQGNRNVVIFGLAFLLSAFGYEFMVFVMTVHIYDLTGSAMNVGLFTALTFLPRLFSPYYGSICGPVSARADLLRRGDGDRARRLPGRGKQGASRGRTRSGSSFPSC